MKFFYNLFVHWNDGFEPMVELFKI